MGNICFVFEFKKSMHEEAMRNYKSKGNFSHLVPKFPPPPQVFIFHHLAKKKLLEEIITSPENEKPCESTHLKKNTKIQRSTTIQSYV